MFLITSFFIISQYSSEGVLKLQIAGLFGQNKGVVMDINEFNCAILSLSYQVYLLLFLLFFYIKLQRTYHGLFSPAYY